MDINETIETSISRVMERYVVRHTIPIFHESDQKLPKNLVVPNGAAVLSAHGSGIFLTYKGNYIILTAAHVLEGESKALFIPHPNEEMPLIQLTAQFAFYVASDSSTSDLGCILLTKEIGELVRYRYEPTDIENIGLDPGDNIINSIEIFSTNYKYMDYCICGYPAAANKPKDKLHQNIIYDLRFANEWKNNKVYTKHKINKEEHTIIQVGLYLNFNGKRIPKDTIPPMNGMSGCGVWSYNPYFDKYNELQIFYKLAGVFHTYKNGTHEYMQFTKFSVIQEYIRTKIYPLGKDLRIRVNNGLAKNFWG